MLALGAFVTQSPKSRLLRHGRPSQCGMLGSDRAAKSFSTTNHCFAGVLSCSEGTATGDRGRTLARWLAHRFPKPQFDGVCKCQMRLAPSAPLVISCMRGPLGGFLMEASINRRCSWPLNTWILPRTDRIETGGVETPATYSSVRHAVNGPQSVHPGRHDTLHYRDKTVPGALRGNERHKRVTSSATWGRVHPCSRDGRESTAFVLVLGAGDIPLVCSSDN